jgi:hypothetical protein
LSTDVSEVRTASIIRLIPDDQEKEFKHLSRIARHVLCVLATSASSERNFSAAGFVVQERRTSSESVDSILLLHKNLQ